MTHHTVGLIEKLEQQLRERFEKLLADMHGREVTKEDMCRGDCKVSHRNIISGDIRVSVDDFATVLKEIKASLGKR